MTELVGYALIFIAVGIGFLFVNMFVGRLVRPEKPNPEKQSVYECGEEAVGSSYVRFDLRFYVVALLFVIFDVEVAFFFPWAVVFGTATRAGDDAFAWLAFADIAVFFGVLLVGFAYLWKRGDLEWVRSIEGQNKEREE